VRAADPGLMRLSGLVRAVWLCGLGNGDGEAEGLELADVVAELAVGVEVVLVVAGAQVDEPGCGVGEQVPDVGDR
jgi:hypothetical protein